MKRFLIGSSIFVIGLVVVFTAMLVPVFRRIAERKTTGTGIVLSRETAIVAIAVMIVLAFFSAWVSGRIVHR